MLQVVQLLRSVAEVAHGPRDVLQIPPRHVSVLDVTTDATVVRGGGGGGSSEVRREDTAVAVAALPGLVDVGEKRNADVPQSGQPRVQPRDVRLLRCDAICDVTPSSSEARDRPSPSIS